MADLVFDAFSGGALSGIWTTDHANGGSSAVGSGNLTLSITGTAGSRARIRTASTTMADGDTFQFTITSGQNFNCYFVMRDNTGSTVFQPAIGVVGDAWKSYIYRDSSGGAPFTSGPTIASRPTARMRRSGATLVCETYNGATWDTFDTLDATTGGGLWTPAFGTARAEVMINDLSGITGPGSLVVDQVGAGGGSAPTISAISPTSGPIGQVVTVTGTNFTGATGATIGPSASLTSFVVDSALQVHGTIPSGAPASGTIRVTTAGGTAVGPTFTVTPIFTSLSVSNPNSIYTIGVLLTPIVVTALDQYGATYLGALANCTVASLSLPLTVVGTLSVAFVAGIATFSNLTPSSGVVIPVPAVVSVSPTHGVSGSLVTFTGTGFTGLTSVKLDGVACLFTVGSDTMLTAIVP